MTKHYFSDKRINIVEDIGEPVGSVWKALQEHHADDEFFVAAPLSRTPLPLYNWVVHHASEFENWNTFRFVFMDEQVQKVNNKLKYFPIDNAASFECFGRKHFLHPLSEKVSISEEHMILKPDLENFAAFDELIQTHGGLDLLILAIGEEGHYALVMPGTPLEQGYHLTQINPKVVTQHVEKSGPYKNSDFGDRGMSLGPQQVIGAKHVVVIISGEQKRDLAKQLFTYTVFDPQFPLSIIFHPKVFNKVKIFITPDVLPK